MVSSKNKTKETEIFKKNLNEKFDNKVNFYFPKFQKKKKKHLQAIFKTNTRKLYFLLPFKIYDKYFVSKINLLKVCSIFYLTLS